MADWAAGLLGGVMGVGKAVDEIGTEKRKELAEHLKMQALEKIEERADVRRHGYAKELAGEEMDFRKGESAVERKSREDIAGKGITSAEKIASERNEALKWIAKLETDMKERVLGEDKKGREAQEMRAKVAAFTEARHVLEGGGSTEEANAVLEAAGLPTYEEYIKEPGSEGGIFGWGKTAPVMGRRLQGTTGAAAETKQGEGGTTTVKTETTTPSGQPTGLKSDLDRLVAEGRKTMPPATEAKPEKIEQPTGKAGMIGDASAAGTDTAKVEEKEEILTIEGMQVKRIGDKFEVYDEATKKWRAPTGRERAIIEDEVYGPPEAPIKFSSEPANIRQEQSFPTGRRNPWRR